MIQHLPEFTAAYMRFCMKRPPDCNEIGYPYAREMWIAAVEFERDRCARIAVKEMTRCGTHLYRDDICRVEAAIRKSDDDSSPTK